MGRGHEKRTPGFPSVLSETGRRVYPPHRGRTFLPRRGLLGESCVVPLFAASAAADVCTHSHLPGISSSLAHKKKATRLPRRPATLEALPMNRPLSPRSISHAGHTPSSRHAPRRDTFTARPVLVMSSPFHASTALWRVPAGEEATRSDMSRFTPFWVIWPRPGRRGGVLS